MSSSLKARLAKLEEKHCPKVRPLLTWVDIVRGSELDEPLDLSRYANGEDFAELFAALAHAGKCEHS